MIPVFCVHSYFCLLKEKVKECFLWIPHVFCSMMRTTVHILREERVRETRYVSQNLTVRVDSGRFSHVCAQCSFVRWTCSSITLVSPRWMQRFSTVLVKLEKLLNDHLLVPPSFACTTTSDHKLSSVNKNLDGILIRNLPELGIV